MSVLSDKTIRDLCTGENPMISPFVGQSVKVDPTGKKIASYGLSSGGYDIRAAGEFKLFIPPTKLTFWQRLQWLFTGHEPEQSIIDYKNIPAEMFSDHFGDYIDVPPGGFLLTRSVERIAMPRDVLAVCIGKSTIARAGWNCLCTPLECGWPGYVTLEFQNTTCRTNRFYANEGCLQLVFHRLDQECETSYADRGGKYLNQGAEIITPRV
jgi:dCTP deaminase